VTGFLRKDGELTCDGVPLSEVARAVGTPTYVYSAALLGENFRRFDAAFEPVPHLVCYAAKANSSLTLLA
jgi:diaminopimelate decarboxylase